MRWIFRRHQPSTKITGQVDSLPNRPVEDGRTAIKADPDAPIRRGWLGGLWNYRLSTLVWKGMAGLLLLLCYLCKGVPLVGKAAREPSYPLFKLDKWDVMQREVQSEHFSNSGQIQASLEQRPKSLHRCRFLIEGANVDLGTVIMGHIRERVFDGKCSSVLPVVVGRSHGKTQRALDCTKDSISTVVTAMHQVQEAQSVDDRTYIHSGATLLSFETPSRPRGSN